MARPIDLDQLMKYPLRRESAICDEEHADPHFLNGVESVLEWAQTLPTLTPPNEPLTLEQLREMDGEPVWVERENAWGIVEIQEGKPFIFGTNFECGYSPHWNIYRRPPEGEEDT